VRPARVGAVAPRGCWEITEETYQREYAGNVTVLPRLTRSSIRPDVHHMLIHVAVLAAGVACWVSVFTTP
jgi:hypothetical protein